MAKSTACLKIIACGNNDSVDRDDLGASETKVSSDRRGWSFRKRSSRHRVLSNAANSEVANKESPESHVVSFQTQPDLAVQEKTPSVEWTELEDKSNLPAQTDSKIPDTQMEEQSTEDPIYDESNVVKIQAASRGFLARRLLSKQNSNVIKLQAAVRGHLVRTHAVGTLRCLQAIVKMQALVRARRALRDNSTGKGDLVSTKIENKSSRDAYTYVAIDQLFYNLFARKLMETTPRTQPIRIKCEPLKSDSDTAWKWLERWMSASSVRNKEPSSEPPTTEHSEKETLNCSKASSDNNAKRSVAESEDVRDNDLVGHEANNIDVMSQNPSEPQNGNDQESDDPIEIGEQHLRSEMEGEEEFMAKETETETETIVPDLKSSSSTEQPEAEAKKFSRKASNPDFVAAQSKFEGLSSAAASTAKEITSSSGNDSVANPGSDNANDSVDDLSLSKDNPTVQTVTSTLDSRDSSSEVEVTGKETDSIQQADSNQPENTIPAINGPADPLQGDENNLQSSPNASPQSHITFPESQATLSSQVSVNKRKKSGGEKTKLSGNKAKSSSSGDRKAFLNRNNQDSASKNSSGKKQANEQDKEHEARVSSVSSSLLPSYMQATESARAKAVSNGSPRSSPDVHDKDMYLKKRHSLPGGHERQGSPRIHRSLSQTAQQNGKGNGTQSPQDRKWRR